MNFISSEIPDPMIPPDELIRTVAGLKKDLNISEEQDVSNCVDVQMCKYADVQMCRCANMQMGFRDPG